MKTSDFVQQYIEDSQRLSRQLEAYATPDLSGISQALEKNNYLERIKTQIDLASGLDISRLSEAARIASGHFDALKQSIATAGFDYAETVRKMTEVPESVRVFQEFASNYEKQFRLINSEDMRRAGELAAKIAVPDWLSSVSAKNLEFQRQLEMMKVPFIQMKDSLKSLRGFSELAAIGTAVQLAQPFETGFVQNLRRDLGDWRDASIDADDLLDDPVGRVALYEKHGFNAELTDFPAEGFESALTVTGIDLGSVSTALAPPRTDIVPAFNVHAYQWLFVFERELRAFQNIRRR